MRFKLKTMATSWPFYGPWNGKILINWPKIKNTEWKVYGNVYFVLKLRNSILCFMKKNPH